MALSVLTQPAAISYSKNPILYAIQTDQDPLAEINLRIEAIITVTDETGNSTSISIYEEPDAAGKVTYNLSELFNSLFEKFHAPFSSSAIIQSIAFHHFRYSIVFNEKSGNPLASKNSISITDRFVVHGGRSQHLPYLTQFIAWTQYLALPPANRTFLTRQPSPPLVSPATPHWLLYYLTSNIGVDGSANIKLHYTIFYSDGLNHSGSFGPFNIDLEYDRIICIRAGISQLSLDSINPAKTIIQYKLRLTDSSDNPLSAEQTFNVDNRHYLNEIFCLFKNSAGGWDTLRLLGQSELLPEYDEQIYSVRQDILINNYRTENNFFSDTNETVKLKLHTGHANITRAHTDWIRDVRLAPLCYLSHTVSPGNFFWMPAKCISKKLDMPNSREWLLGIPLEFRLLTNSNSWSSIPPINL
jgi:hypothetical protein